MLDAQQGKESFFCFIGNSQNLFDVSSVFSLNLAGKPLKEGFLPT
jgi:hypothetical protein